MDQASQSFMKRSFFFLSFITCLCLVPPILIYWVDPNSPQKGAINLYEKEVALPTTPTEKEFIGAYNTLYNFNESDKQRNDNQLFNFFKNSASTVKKFHDVYESILFDPQTLTDTQSFSYFKGISDSLEAAIVARHTSTMDKTSGEDKIKDFSTLSKAPNLCTNIKKITSKIEIEVNYTISILKSAFNKLEEQSEKAALSKEDHLKYSLQRLVGNSIKSYVVYQVCQLMFVNIPSYFNYQNPLGKKISTYYSNFIASSYFPYQSLTMLIWGMNLLKSIDQAKHGGQQFASLIALFSDNRNVIAGILDKVKEYWNKARQKWNEKKRWEENVQQNYLYRMINSELPDIARLLHFFYGEMTLRILGATILCSLFFCIILYLFQRREIDINKICNCFGITYVVLSVLAYARYDINKSETLASPLYIFSQHEVSLKIVSTIFKLTSLMQESMFQVSNFFIFPQLLMRCSDLKNRYVTRLEMAHLYNDACKMRKCMEELVADKSINQLKMMGPIKEFLEGTPKNEEDNSIHALVSKAPIQDDKSLWEKVIYSFIQGCSDVDEYIKAISNPEKIEAWVEAVAAYHELTLAIKAIDAMDDKASSTCAISRPTKENERPIIAINKAWMKYKKDNDVIEENKNQEDEKEKEKEDENSEDDLTQEKQDIFVSRENNIWLGNKIINIVIGEEQISKEFTELVYYIIDQATVSGLVNATKASLSLPDKLAYIDGNKENATDRIMEVICYATMNPHKKVLIIAPSMFSKQGEHATSLLYAICQSIITKCENITLLATTPDERIYKKIKKEEQSHFAFLTPELDQNNTPTGKVVLGKPNQPVVVSTLRETKVPFDVKRKFNEEMRKNHYVFLNESQGISHTQTSYIIALFAILLLLFVYFLRKKR